MTDTGPTTISVNDPDFTSLCLEILNDGHSIRFAAHGLSMTPCIRDGEIVTVVPAAASDLRIGDIVLYRTVDDRLTAHRLLGRKVDQSGLTFGMRGDACTACREIVRADRILGRVGYVERKGRKHRLDGRLARLLHVCRAIVWQIRAKAGHRIHEAGLRFRT